MIFIMLTASRKNLGMTENVPHWKIGPWLLCGRMDAVMKNFFFNLKLDLFLVLKANFQCDFWVPPPKKVQRCKFSWRLALKNSSYNIFIRYRNFKMTYFWKKALKLPKFQTPNRRNHLVLGEKILLTFVSYKWEHLSNIRSKSESLSLKWNHP